MIDARDERRSCQFLSVFVRWVFPAIEKSSGGPTYVAALTCVGAGYSSLAVGFGVPSEEERTRSWLIANSASSRRFETPTLL